MAPLPTVEVGEGGSGGVMVRQLGEVGRGSGRGAVGPDRVGEAGRATWGGMEDHRGGVGCPLQNI